MNTIINLSVIVKGLSGTALRAFALKPSLIWPDPTVDSPDLSLELQLIALPEHKHQICWCCLLFDMGEDQTVDFAITQMGLLRQGQKYSKTKMNRADLNFDYIFADYNLAFEYLFHLKNTLRILQPQKYFAENDDFFSWGLPDLSILLGLKADGVTLTLSLLMGTRALKRHGLSSPDKWFGGNLKASRQKIFDKVLRKAFRLGESLRHDAPLQAEVENLSEIEQGLFAFYMNGGEPSNHPNVSDSSNPLMTLNSLRRSILAKIDIDIRIPWAKHQKIRHAHLKEIVAGWRRDLPPALPL